MSTELPSKYDPSSVEAQAYQVWLDEKCFHADPSAPGESFCIVIPPPNVTGALHLGHAMNNTLQDILTRQHRMAGFNALWVPGIDHAGIATQAVVEKQLKEQENKTRHDVGREGLVARIWKWKEQYGDRILEQLKRLGCSCDWDRTRFTLDEMCARAVRETFFKLFKDGLIYRGKRLVNWDTFLQTSISDDEIYHETVKTSLWHIRYPISSTISSTGFQPVSDSPQNSDTAVQDNTLRHGQDAHATGATYMTVATTRPETMLGDTAVAVHSDDPRWNWAIGKHVRLPLTNRLIPIIADNILVDPKFGTGVVKVTPAHDPNDYAVWQRHKGQPDEIDLINILTPDGKITSDRPEWSKYAGMKRAAARAQVVEDLKAAGLLEKEEPYETQVGHSDRSKTPVEPYLSDQWFVKMAPLAEPALEVVREGKIKFYPERHAQQYLSWLGEKRDWPVSRQLWWGHRIPIWVGELDLSPDKDRGFPHDENLAELAADSFSKTLGCDWNELSRRNECWTEICRHPETPHKIIARTCIKNDATELARQLESKGWMQDPDVLDTWFSSALWPHSTLGWPEKTPELAKYYPTSVLLTGRDIITLWVARMVMMGMYNMGRGTGGPPVSSSAEQQDHGRAARATNAPAPSPLYSGERAGVRGETSETSASDTSSTTGPSPQPSPLSTGAREPEARSLGIPFLDVAINPTILDGKGERMSKSKGNGVDPVDIIHSHGADALRFTLTNMATETQDARMPVQVVCPHCGERLPNPDSKDPEMACAKCKKKLTRPMNNATGSDEAPLARMTSDRFDLGRNFCNKLWNACRFALANLENVRAEESAAAEGFEPIALGRSSDEDLMQLTQQGDKKAFSLLYERYSASVLSYLYRILGKVEDVETIGQEVFLRAFRFAATYQYPHKFSTWLFTITRNLAMNQSWRKERGPIRRFPELSFIGIDMSGRPEEIAARATDNPESREEIARVLKALDALPPEQKEVITLGVFRDLTYEEMQEITGVKVDTLQSSMYHGLKRLAQSLGSDTASSLSVSPSLDPSIPQSLWSLADRWIISRFHRTVAECDDALKSYRFDVYAKSCYDFFWRDFCDWYVEAIKPAMKDPARAAQTADVLAAVLDGSLRLMHPMIPFITETVWWRLNDVRPQRGLGELLPCPPSKRLVLAPWPTSPRFSPGGHAGSAPHDPAKPPGLNEALIADADDAAVIFPKLQEIISSIRTIRNDYQVNPKQTVPVSIKPPADFAGQIEENRELIELLAVCSLKAVQSDLAPLANAVTSSAAGCDIFVEGLIDPNAERLRLAKDIEAKKKSVEALKTRLGSASYVAKAPPHLVQQTRDQLAAAEAEVVKMEESLRKLG